ncbi:hypothetical protein HDU83_005754 [Entophlyctis luteolus]|nr:hypothetical protein HDU82_003664 [Entophlyctis luteolus]KAJ3354148.1 hypothetical protein HDU83_005754 [Entophlyctis luteolus]KAJ3392665.1 hypothetical protein HDU84_003671 [Entophlyctis sp. JEL0112]
MVFQFLSLFVLASAPIAFAATVCNGYAALCSRTYDNVTFIGAHDSYAVDTDVLDLSATQNIDVTAQLNAGVRMLEVQGHLINSNHIELCHTKCGLYDGGSLTAYLTKVVTWMNANPNEVVTILMTNNDDVAVNAEWLTSFQASGIDQLAYIPPYMPLPRGHWPTLGQMIDSGRRAVLMLDYEANFSEVDYVFNEFAIMFETPYDSTDSSFPCSVNRGVTGNMYLINHYLDYSVFGILIPDRAKASTTNSVSSIVADASGCAAGVGGGRYPNFVLLDWVDQGEPLTAAKQLNGL